MKKFLILHTNKSVMKLKHIILFVVVLFTATSVHAQQQERFNPQTDKREMNGYTIRLIPAPGNTFGFSVMQGKRPVWVQLSNPFSHAPTGFKNKEDAYKLAGWIINEKATKGRLPQRIPADVAKQLNLPTGALNK